MSSAGTLSDILAARSTEVAEAVRTAVAHHFAPYPIALVTEHQRDRVEATIDRVLELAAAGELFADEELSPLRALGRQYARRSVPLSVVMTAFDEALTTATREYWLIAPVASFVEMARLTGLVARISDQARQACAGAYLAAGHARGGPRSMGRLLAEALVDGVVAPAAARVAGQRLASSYLVLVCSPPGPEVDGLGSAEIHRHVDGLPGVLRCGDRSRLIVLFPVGAVPVGAVPVGVVPVGPEAARGETSRREAESQAAALVDRFCALTGQLVPAAIAYRPDLAEIPAAVEEATRVISLVRAIPDAEPRPYRIDDMLVELAILGQPEIRRRLAAVLTPLDAGTDLRRTLEVLLACDLDRERAAKELCIHRRTLWYRLDRVRKLSGIDPDSVRGLHLFRAALTAARLVALEAVDPSAEITPVHPSALSA